MDIDMKDTWKYIDEISKKSLEDPEIECVHVDTRDFHVNVCSDPKQEFLTKEERKTILSYCHNNQYNSANFVFSTEEMLERIKNIETWSGGKGNWRSIFIKPTNGSLYKERTGWDFKYLRFFKIKDNEWIMLNRNKIDIVYKNVVVEENIDKENCWCH